jgi:hypothetical protein
VDEASAGHRLDHPDHRLVLDAEPARKSSQAVVIRRAGELLDELALVGEQADIDPLATEIQPSVQHVLGPPWCSFFGWTSSVATEEVLLHVSPKRRSRPGSGLLVDPA